MWDCNVKNPINLRKHVSLKVVCLVNQGEILSYGFKLVKSDSICLQLANLLSHTVSTYNWQTICDKGEWKKVTKFASTCRWCQSFQLQCLHVLRLGLFIRYAPHFVFLTVPLILNFYGVILQMKFQEFLSNTTILIETTHHNIFSQDMDILGALPLVHSLMQIPPNKKHSEVHWTHGKNKMEEAIVVRHFIICHIPFVLRELQFKIAQISTSYRFLLWYLEGHNQLESFHQNVFNPIADISCILGDYPCNKVCKYFSRLIRNTKKSYDTADFIVLLMWWLITLIHASEHKSVCVCVCVWRKGERKKKRKRKSNTENGTESNPIVNGQKYCRKCNQNTLQYNYQCVTSEHANCSNKVSTEAKHHQKTSMWFNPHSNSIMYARSPMMLCSQHHLMQEVHNLLEITVTHTPYNWAKAENQANSYVLHVILLVVLQTMPCYFIYTLLAFKWWEALTITVSQSPFPIWRGRVLQVADSGSLHT